MHDGVGPYVLLVHGLLSSRAQWQANLTELSRYGRPVVVELLGHGRSPASDDATSYAPAAYVRAFETLRASLGAERWVLVGQSLGASLTLAYALDHPDRVLAHVFTNSTSALGEPAPEPPAALRALAERLRGGSAAELARIPVHPRHARSLPDAYYRALVEDSLLLDPRAVGLGFLHTVSGASQRARLAQNRVPTLLTVGVRERRFAALAAHAERVMPRLEVARFECGHAVNIEAAKPWNEAVGHFLARRAPAR